MDDKASGGVWCFKRSSQYCSSTGLSWFLQGICTGDRCFFKWTRCCPITTGKDGQIHVIAYVSCSLHPSERSMDNYSSAKLELLALKWAVMEKFRDYLLGSWFQVYTDNNPLTYVMESKLRASQIWWLSELALFDFVIKYQTGLSNRATDALSHHPFNPTCDDSLSKSEADSDECEVISYSSVCGAVDLCLNSTKIPKDLKQGVQDISCAIMEEEDMNENEIVSSECCLNFWTCNTKTNVRRAAKRSNSQAGIPTSHSRWKAKNIGYSQN